MSVLFKPSSQAPNWASVQTSTLNMLAGAAVGLVCRSLSPLHGGVIGLASNFFAYVVTDHYINAQQTRSSGMSPLPDDIRRKIYAYSHLVAVPIVCCGAVILGCPITIPAALVLTIVNVATAYLGAHFCCKGRRTANEGEGFQPQVHGGHRLLADPMSMQAAGPLEQLETLREELRRALARSEEPYLPPVSSGVPMSSPLLGGHRLSADPILIQDAYRRERLETLREELRRALVRSEGAYLPPVPVAVPRPSTPRPASPVSSPDFMPSITDQQSLQSAAGAASPSPLLRKARGLSTSEPTSDVSQGGPSFQRSDTPRPALYGEQIQKI